MRKNARSPVLLITLIVVSLGITGMFACKSWAFNEAPVLSKQVKDGTLPPVDKRLPESPVVVKPVDKPGFYGGTWRRAYLGLADLVGVRRILYDPLVRWSPEYKIEPNLAWKWDIDPEGRSFTFYLVKGVRWSDGEPFTADDIVFYFDDIIYDKELTPSVPMWLAPSGKPPKVSKIDDYTFRIEFDEPYSLFLERLACPDGMALVTKPKHYLKKFHKKYAKPEELDSLMKQKNATSWVKLFQDASDLQRALFVETGLPSICAWVTTVPAPAKRFIMQRNPYYWKVDTQGNQLPYIDTIVHDLQAEAQTIVLKAIAGEIDMQGRNLGGMQNSVLLLASVGQGKFRLVPKTATASVGSLLSPNLNHKEPVMQKIFADRRFRIALSHAVNRNELNKIVYRGKGIPRQAAPLPESDFYSASYEKAYLDYDPAKAASLLDEMGLKLSKEGKRLRPDGQPLRLSIDVMVSIQTWVDTAEILASNFKSIGIDTEVKSETRELFRQRTQSGAHEMALWSGDGGMECLLDPRWYFPYSSESLNAPLYGQWCQTGGKKGEEPPQDIKNLMEIYNKILRTVSPEERKKLFSQIIAANEQNLWVIGLVHNPPDYYVVAPNMFNVPKKDFESWIYPNPGPIHPEQFSFELKK
ncbi:MAG TPA: ABC transporter substrate-binding protein [Desulfomonilaceae bacterium]|nr:ABC transporter substrate-binding protein [Desulfomonilaceae bacterium]